MALYKRKVQVFLGARTGTNLFSSLSPICVTGPACIRKGDTGYWQCTFCHLALAFVKRDELKPVIRIKQYKLFFNLFGFRQLAFFFFFSTLLDLVDWAPVGHVAVVVL